MYPIEMKSVRLKAACKGMKDLLTIKAYQLAMFNLVMSSLHSELILSNRGNGLQTHETLWMNLKHYTNKRRQTPYQTNKG